MMRSCTVPAFVLLCLSSACGGAASGDDEGGTSSGVTNSGSTNSGSGASDTGDESSESTSGTTDGATTGGEVDTGDASAGSTSESGSTSDAGTSSTAGDGDSDGTTTGGDGDFPGGQASTTHYTGIDEGRCGFQAIPVGQAPYERIAALPTWLFGDAQWCGAFIELDSSTGSTFESCGGVSGDKVIVMVSDECPADTNQEHCYDGAWHFDLSQPAFSDMADLSCGVLESISWKVIEGTHAGNVKIRNKDGINQWWYSLYVVDHNYAITRVEIRADGGDWQDATRSDTNFWNIESAVGLVLPLDVRITDIHDQIILRSDVVTSLDENVEFDMGAQFPAGQGGGGTLGP